MILSVWRSFVVSSVLPEFEGVDDVLPQHVAASANGCHRIQIGIRHPDAEGGILLEGCLTGIDLFAQMAPYTTTDEEEHEAEYQTEQGYHNQQRESCLAMDDVTHGDT